MANEILEGGPQDIAYSLQKILNQAQHAQMYDLLKFGHQTTDSIQEAL